MLYGAMHVSKGCPVSFGRHCLRHSGVRVWPPDINMRSAREEAEMVIFESVREVLDKCKLRASQVADVQEPRCTVMPVSLRPPSRLHKKRAPICICFGSHDP